MDDIIITIITKQQQVKKKKICGVVIGLFRKYIPTAT
jgi:hypothetical protein